MQYAALLLEVDHAVLTAFRIFRSVVFIVVANVSCHERVAVSVARPSVKLPKQVSDVSDIFTTGSKFQTSKFGCLTKI